MRKHACTLDLLASLMLAFALAAAPLALTACSGGSSEQPAEEQSEPAEETTETEAEEPAEEEAEDAASEDDGTPAYVDQFGTLNVRAIDELGIMREQYDLEFSSVITNDGNGYLFNLDTKRWESDHGWFLIYDEKAEVLPGPGSYDVIQMNAKMEAQPIIAVVAVSKEDYPDIQDAYKAVAEGPMGESDKSEFNSDGTWGKGVVSGGADEYLILAGDGGDVWQVDIIPQTAMQQALYIQLTGETSLDYVEAYVKTPEGTLI